jgi:hypothetical protein
VKKTIAVVLVGTVLAGAANADVKLSDYRKAKTDGGVQWEFMKTYFLGAGNAYGWANSLPRLVKAPLFCPPAQMILQQQNYLDILDAEIVTRQPMKDDTYIDIFLLLGLQRTFPCKQP